MANSNNKIFAIQKLHATFVNKTGINVSEDTKKLKEQGQLSNEQQNKVPLNEQIYLIQRDQTKNLEAAETSQKPEFNVLYLNDTQTGKKSFSADKVKHYFELKKQGKLPSNISLSQVSLEKYIDISQSKEKKNEFESAIKSKGNDKLGTVMRLMIEAKESGNHGALGYMIENIRKDQNFAFMFEGGKVDFSKIEGMSNLPNDIIEKGFDLIEFIEDRYGIINSLDARDHSILYAGTRGIPDHILDKMMEMDGLKIDDAAVQEMLFASTNRIVTQEELETEEMSKNIIPPEVEIAGQEVAQEDETLDSDKIETQADEQTIEAIERPTPEMQQEVEPKESMLGKIFDVVKNVAGLAARGAVAAKMAINKDREDPEKDIPGDETPVTEIAKEQPEKKSLLAKIIGAVTRNRSENELAIEPEQNSMAEIDGSNKEDQYNTFGQYVLTGRALEEFNEKTNIIRDRMANPQNQVATVERVGVSKEDDGER